MPWWFFHDCWSIIILAFCTEICWIWQMKCLCCFYTIGEIGVASRTDKQFKVKRKQYCPSPFIPKISKKQFLPNNMNNKTAFPFIFYLNFSCSWQILQYQMQKKNWFSPLSKKIHFFQSAELYLKLIFFFLPCYKINERVTLNMNLN